MHSELRTSHLSGGEYGHRCLNPSASACLLLTLPQRRCQLVLVSAHGVQPEVRKSCGAAVDFASEMTFSASRRGSPIAEPDRRLPSRRNPASAGWRDRQKWGFPKPLLSRFHGGRGRRRGHTGRRRPYTGGSHGGSKRTGRTLFRVLSHIGFSCERRVYGRQPPPCQRWHTTPPVRVAGAHAWKCAQRTRCGAHFRLGTRFCPVFRPPLNIFTCWDVCLYSCGFTLGPQ